MPLQSQTPARLKVIVAGAGVAGLEAAFAMHELARDRVSVTVVSPEGEFTYRPLSIGEPFSSSWAERYPLGPLVSAAGAQLMRDRVAAVDTDRHTIRTASGSELAYDALIVGVGASLQPFAEHATNVDDRRMDELLHGLIQDIEAGYTKRLAIIVPGPMPWPFPAYELALLASERAWDSQTELDVTLLTPERTPLAAFGAQASHAVSELLSQRRIEVVTSAYCEVPRAGLVVVHPGGRTVVAERVVAFPQLVGREISGLPSGGGGFVPIDSYGRVRGIERVWAAGDGTDYPVKLGGIAAQQADAAARSIAALAGADGRRGSLLPDPRGGPDDGRDGTLPAVDAGRTRRAGRVDLRGADRRGRARQDRGPLPGPASDRTRLGRRRIGELSAGRAARSRAARWRAARWRAARPARPPAA